MTPVWQGRFPMQPCDKSINDCLIIIGWSIYELARRLKINRRTVLRWLDGRLPVPLDVLEWLNGLAREHEKAPWPANWF